MQSPVRILSGLLADPAARSETYAITVVIIARGVVALEMDSEAGAGFFGFRKKNLLSQEIWPKPAVVVKFFDF